MRHAALAFGATEETVVPLEEEGPFSEFQDDYVTGTGKNPIVEYQCMTHWHDAIFKNLIWTLTVMYTILFLSSEGKSYGATYVPRRFWQTFCRVLVAKLCRKWPDGRWKEPDHVD